MIQFSSGGAFKYHLSIDLTEGVKLLISQVDNRVELNGEGCHGG